MAEHAVIKMTMDSVVRLVLLVVLLSVTACAAQKQAAPPPERLIKESMPRSPEWQVPPPPPPREPTLPSFVPLTDDIIPLKTKIVSIVVRSSPLGDILHIIADASGLNLLIGDDVPIDQQMTLSLKNISAEEAMKAIFANIDCFYTIEGNVLRVESVTTKIFELGHPALANTYATQIGGNTSGSNLVGSVTSSSTADSKAQDFWGTMETTLNGIFEKNDSKSKLRQSVTINRLTGTIMVTASRKNIDKVSNYIESVRKVLNRGVMIEARIIEVQLNDEMKFGIDWSFLSKTGSLGAKASGGFGALSLASAKDIFTPSASAAATAKNFQVGIAGADFQTLLTALNSQGSIKTLSNPKINVMNGHASILTVGNNTSFISKVTTTNTTSTNGNTLSFSPETTSVLSGMIIGIVPYISERGDISLNITPITSDLLNIEDKDFGSGDNKVTISIPTVALREMTTTVKMRDGQMVIIGGLISNKETTSDAKIPILGDIPYLGKLFTRTNNANRRTELVLLLRPHIVDSE